jgi:hypothetical protein
VYTGELRNLYRNIVRNCEGKKELGRRRHIWEENIELNLKEKIWEGVDFVRIRIRTSGGLL